MAFLRIEDVVKQFGTTPVIGGVSIEARQGEFVVFVGPSGCGKSTLLRLIAGLDEVSAGRIHIDGIDVTDVAPAQRGVSMVFQSYALYPHMTVRENMAFGLKMARTPADEIEQRVRAAAAILKLDPLLERLPKALSGGQRQRVAIGRAIVREPKLFLFDEPLSNLDAELRGEMRVEIARLHRELGVTMVYVTHDQVEAMTLADRIVVLRAGRIEQVGTPAELYDRPLNTFVAGFIGSPRMNFLPARVLEVGAEGVRLAHPALSGQAATWRLASAVALREGDLVTLGLRPEHLALVGSADAGPDPEGEAPAPALRLSVEADYVENLGGASQLYARAADGASLVVHAGGRLAVARGQALALSVPLAQTYLFDAQGQALPIAA